MLVMNGISNPVDFGIPLFFVMEFLTIIIEFIVGTVLIYLFSDKGKQSLTLSDITIIIILINICSALLCFPFWGTLGGN